MNEILDFWRELAPEVRTIAILALGSASTLAVWWGKRKFSKFERQAQTKIANREDFDIQFDRIVETNNGSFDVIVVAQNFAANEKYLGTPFLELRSAVQIPVSIGYVSKIALEDEFHFLVDFEKPTITSQVLDQHVLRAGEIEKFLFKVRSMQSGMLAHFEIGFTVAGVEKVSQNIFIYFEDFFDTVYVDRQTRGYVERSSGITGVRSSQWIKLANELGKRVGEFDYRGHKIPFDYPSPDNVKYLDGGAALALPTEAFAKRFGLKSDRAVRRDVRVRRRGGTSTEHAVEIWARTAKLGAEKIGSATEFVGGIFSTSSHVLMNRFSGNPLKRENVFVRYYLDEDEFNDHEIDEMQFDREDVDIAVVLVDDFKSVSSS